MSEIVLKANIFAVNHQESIGVRSEMLDFLTQVNQLPLKFTTAGIYVIDKTFAASVIF